MLSEETVAVATPQSTSFTIELCQMSKILKYHIRQSLCLIDEFGKGTTPTDGMALLLAAVIKHFSAPAEKKSHNSHLRSLLLLLLSQ
jgi:DNA mismatch repair protein MSH5